MAIEKELLDRLLAGRDPNEVFSRDGLLDDLKKALSERILNTELDEHLDDEREADGPGNRRNGHSKKTVLTGTSKMTLLIPRDRAGTFDPKLIAKYQRRFRQCRDRRGRRQCSAQCLACARATSGRQPRDDCRHRVQKVRTAGASIARGGVQIRNAAFLTLGPC